MKRTIFISYRRDDSEGEAGRLFDDLVRAFGDESVFMDVAGIAPGVDFRKAIDDNVSGCGVFLAIIGSQWATVASANGERRLDDANDFVRLEIASALARNVAVIPVLVHGARMPHPEQLPENIKDLAYRNSVEISHARWNSDVELLVGALKSYVTTTRATANDPVHATIPVQLPPPVTPYTAPEPKKTKLPLIVGVSIVGILVVAAIAFFALNRKTEPNVTVPSTASGAAATPATAPQSTAVASSPLAGTWINTKLSNGNNAFLQLKISGSGNQFTVDPAGQCGANTCDWGTQSLTFDGTSMTGTWKVTNLPVEVRNNRTVQMTIRPNGADLDVATVNSATDPSGQTQSRNFDFRFVRGQ